MKKVFSSIIAIIVMSLVLVSCSNKTIKAGYSVYPVQYLLEKIGGNRVETFPLSDESNVLRSQLAGNYKDVLKNTDVLFTIGELEPYLSIINQDIADYKPNIIDLGIKSSVYKFGRHTTDIVDNTVVVVESNYYENPIFEDVDSYTNDPYIWLDPITMTSVASQILEYFVSVDPDNTGYYTANFDAVKMELAYLDANYLELRKNNKLSFATMLPSFGIYENNYNFLISPVILSKYGQLPTEAQLELIKVRLISDNAKYLILEDDLDKDIMDLANSLAAELSLEIIKLSSLSSRTQYQVDNDLDYIAIMNDNLNILESLIEK